MRDPFKLVVWGPGGLGAACIYEIAQRADLQLVGVRGYDPAKEGIDAGTLIGIAPLGVAISADAQKVAQIECDAIIYTPRDLGNYNNDDEILWLLRSGRNIITALPYQHVKLTREPEFVAKLEQACLEGGSVFHATGVDPDIISDRVLAGLSGFCNDIQSIRLQENWDQAYGPADTLMLCGFCKTVEEAQAMPIAAGIADNFLRTVCYGVGHTFKVTYDRVESSHEYVLTDQDIQLTHITVPAGTVGRVTHRCGRLDRRPRKTVLRDRSELALRRRHAAARHRTEPVLDRQHRRSPVGEGGGRSQGFGRERRPLHRHRRSQFRARLSRGDRGLPANRAAGDAIQARHPRRDLATRALAARHARRLRTTA